MPKFVVDLNTTILNTFQLVSKKSTLFANHLKWLLTDWIILTSKQLKRAFLRLPASLPFTIFHANVVNTLRPELSSSQGLTRPTAYLHIFFIVIVIIIIFLSNNNNKSATYRDILRDIQKENKTNKAPGSVQNGIKELAAHRVYLRAAV